MAERKVKPTKVPATGTKGPVHLIVIGVFAIIAATIMGIFARPMMIGLFQGIGWAISRGRMPDASNYR